MQSSLTFGDMGSPWWQRLGLWISIFGILIVTGCGSPNTVAVTPPAAPTDTSASVSTTVRVTESAGFAIDYRVTSQWGNGFTAEVTIHNISPDPIPAWTLNWTFPQDPIQITNLWNGTVSQTSTQVTVSNLSHNGVIPAGGSVNFGFQASYPGGDLTTPVAFIFNGQPLAQPTPTPASLACLVDYTVSSSWNEGFVANLTIRNLGGSVTGWELGFDFPVDGVNITNLWNGSLTQTGRTVQVTNLDWNKTIPANGTASVGFQAAHPGGSVTPTGFRLNGVPCTGQPATPVPSPSPDPLDELFPILPPEPGLVNNQTLAGIDADEDGTRDDIQRWIYRLFPSPEEEQKRKALLQFARTYQERLLQSENLQESIRLTYEVFGSLHCTVSIFGLEESNDLTSLLEFLINNTELRVKASLKNDLNFGGQNYTLPDRSQYPSFCKF